MNIFLKYLLQCVFGLCQKFYSVLVFAYFLSIALQSACDHGGVYGRAVV